MAVPPPLLTLVFRTARAADLPAIVALLADDGLGRGREDASHPLPRAYHDAFAAMDAQPGNEYVGAEREGRIVGCLQITLIAGLSRQGLLRAQIEGVRVAASQRGHGVGEALLRHAIECARDAGAKLVQLTSDARRTDARRFYERLGFAASHVGFKLEI